MLGFLLNEASNLTSAGLVAFNGGVINVDVVGIKTYVDARVDTILFRKKKKEREKVDA